MTLSILCITNGKPYAEKFISRMYDLAWRLNAELVLGLDRCENKYKCHKSIELTADTLQEDVMDEAVEFCDSEYILRLDDDESVSPALEKWLLAEGYKSGLLFCFPRVYFHGDEKHILNNEGMFPDLQTRLGKKNWMYGVNHVHAGNPNGSGMLVPYAIEHHTLLVKTLTEREAVSAKYESLMPGAGTLPQYARFNIPEKFYKTLTVDDYKDGDYTK